MIISRTPLRISLMGGGTDLPQFYKRYGGAVVSLAIDKFVYVSVNDKFDGRTRVSYSVTETVDFPVDLNHDIVRNAMAFLGLRGLEITSVSDIPGEGTGLGSSSSFTVGLLNSFRAGTANSLAELAFKIEAKLCGHPCGKQDQYAAAHGGLHCYEFEKDGSVTVERIPVGPAQEYVMGKNMLLLYTGITRSADVILRDQERNLSNKRESIRAALEMRDLAIELSKDLNRDEFHKIGTYLHEGWKFKKRLSDAISAPALDQIYSDAISAGAIGGKLLGAGGGGFFLFWADPKYHKSIVECTGLRQIPFKYHPQGSEIIYDSQA